MTDAHFQSLALKETLRLWFPEHEPREKDPHYRFFHQAKKALKEHDVPCWRCGVRYADLGQTTESNPLGAKQLEAHHNDIEFSLANAVDVETWWTSTYSDVAGFLAKHPEFAALDHKEVFLTFVESEGNLQQLCDVCHRSTHQGIHHIPYPEWRPLAIWRKELPPHVQ